MNERQIKRKMYRERVVGSDPEQNRHKSQQQIMQEWRGKKLGALVYSVPGLVSLFYALNWFRNLEEWTRGGAIPMDISIAIGTLVFCSFGWWFYAFSAYRCPKCHRFLGIDFFAGFTTLLGVRSRERDYCRHCSTNLS